jgi:hypothetical protein
MEVSFMKKIIFIIIIIIVLPAQSFCAWDTGVTKTGDFIYAATVNDSGNLLGVYCSTTTSDCLWLLGLTTACKEDSKYPTLANSETGAGYIEVYCSAQLENGMYRYVFSNFDQITDIISKNLIVGFALPLQGDQFKVVRFDLSGSNRAISKVLEAAVEIDKNKSSSKTSKTTGTKDQNL